MSHKADILTLGCRVNHYESTAIGEELEKLGIEMVGSHGEKSDIYIVNSCAVTEESVRKTRQLVRRAVKKADGGFVGVMGCASQLFPGTFSGIDGVTAVLGSRNKKEMLLAVEKYLRGTDEKYISVSKPDGEIEKIGISSFDRTRAYVKIEDGCNGKCSYCIIPQARGDVVLRNSDEIVAEVERLAENGCHEIVLTGIETAAYGEKLGVLIRRVANIEGIERIRLGSMEPSFLKKKFVDLIADIPQFCHHMHISVQSGSSRTLALMKRKYSREQLDARLDYIRSRMPDFNFSADIIVGFPGETEDDFRQSLELVKKYGFVHCHIFRYSPRPGTEAFESRDVIPPKVSENRLHRLETVANRETERVLKKIIENGKEIAILSETFSHGIISGHSEGFIECEVKTNCFEKGKIIRFMPTGISNLKLIGNEKNDKE